MESPRGVDARTCPGHRTIHSMRCVWAYDSNDFVSSCLSESRMASSHSMSHRSTLPVESLGLKLFLNETCAQEGRGGEPEKRWVRLGGEAGQRGVRALDPLSLEMTAAPTSLLTSSPPSPS